MAMFLKFLNFYLTIVDIQYCASFRCLLKLINRQFTDEILSGWRFEPLPSCIYRSYRQREMIFKTGLSFKNVLFLTVVCFKRLGTN